MADLSVKSYDFNSLGNAACAAHKMGRDWSVVYLIHNDEELYIGETSNINNRFKQHLDNPVRNNLTSIKVIFDDEFNKSAALDIEQLLIQYFGADNKYSLQNLNGGQSSKHNYYDRARYISKLDLIWDKLRQKGLNVSDLSVLKNSDLFKFSLYNSLTDEQYEVSLDIIKDMMNCLKTGIDGTAVINGTVGTGKTVVLINLIYKLVNAKNLNIDVHDEGFDEFSEEIRIINEIKQYTKEIGRELEIAFVVPMESIRDTIGQVFSITKHGLKKKMVLGPLDIAKKKYDVVFVDESHRLPREKNIMYHQAYREACNKLGLDHKECSTLDMIVANSKYRVLVYDENQRIKETDVTPQMFQKALSGSKVIHEYLTSQMRCQGGEVYIDYLNKIFNPQTDRHYQTVQNYDFKLFNDVDVMVQSIRKLDKTYGLCRNVAGYSWPWISKSCKTFQEVLDKHLEDIEIQGHKYVWNMTGKQFIISPNAVNEIGCIHTTQGYDLNYVGVIFGPEIDYDSIKNKIVIDSKRFFDSNVKQGATSEDLFNYIINAYKTLMARGIRGCYVYACNNNLRGYLSSLIKNAN